MVGFTKLYGNIIHSSVWAESKETKLVWITMLALANKHGVVEAAVPGLARAAGVTLDECEEALQVLQAPDKYSRTPDNEGRRVERVDGGWLILNHSLYREMRTESQVKGAERVRRWRERNRDEGVTCNAGNAPEAEAEADTEAEADADAEGAVTRAPDVPYPIDPEAVAAARRKAADPRAAAAGAWTQLAALLAQLPPPSGKKVRWGVSAPQGFEDTLDAYPLNEVWEYAVAYHAIVEAGDQPSKWWRRGMFKPEAFETLVNIVEERRASNSTVTGKTKRKSLAAQLEAGDITMEEYRARTKR